jgi:hypothetical protein
VQLAAFPGLSNSATHLLAKSAVLGTSAVDEKTNISTVTRSNAMSQKSPLPRGLKTGQLIMIYFLLTTKMNK